MKAGRYFQIPERPSELWPLWEQAQLLRPDNLPQWLDWEDAATYRYLGSASTSNASDAEKALFLAETDELEIARMVVDEDPRDAAVRHVYMPMPPREAIWSIGIYRGPTPLQLSPAGTGQPVLTADSVTDVAATFVADPFWLRRGGQWQMFFEVMNWKSNKGEIALATSDNGLQWRYEQIVLDEEFHLSYPHVFAHDGQFYMVPESFQDNSIRLYRAKRYPHEWELEAVLLAGQYFADATIFQHNDNWWLFAECNADANDTLRLYRADALKGPWHEHPQSPVVRGDPKHARPAGRVLVTPHQIVRFAQNCGPGYGTDVRAIEIAQLSRTHYAERPIGNGAILGPSNGGWNAGGMHHIDLAQGDDGSWLAAVDGWA